MAEWVKRWGYWIAAKPVRPGIYRLRDGGFLVRTRTTNERTGKRPSATRALRDASLGEAAAALVALAAEQRSETNENRPQRQLFSEFAASRLEAKLLAGDIRSAKGREKFASNLRVHILPTFGTMRCEDIRAWHATAWRTELARKMTEGYESERALPTKHVVRRRLMMSPETANTLIRALRALFREMRSLLELQSDPASVLTPFDTSQRPTYTDESPNSLSADQAKAFLAEMHRRFPQHYAMTLLGFVTGKRPSTLRPIRARGPESDIDWAEGFMRFRRSHTRRDEVMVGTKTKRHERVYLPESVLAALREHRARLETPPLSKREKPPLWWRPKMASSDLLFPARDGGFRTASVLDKPFSVVARAIGLKFRLTPRAMRRTCNDLCRAAEVRDVVTQSITGHLTDRMRVHYSTAAAAEQRQAIAKVIDLVAVRRASGA